MKRRRWARGTATVEWVIVALIVGVALIAAWTLLHDRLARTSEVAGACVEGTLGGGGCTVAGSGGAASGTTTRGAAITPQALAFNGATGGVGRGASDSRATGAPLLPVNWTGMTSDQLIQSLQGPLPEGAEGGIGVQLVIAGRTEELQAIDQGRVAPAPSSRLGAYAATAGYPPGTVGHGVHGAIAAIYITLGDVGQEQIGDVFRSPQAQAEMPYPVGSPHGRAIAELEYDYWRQRRADDWLSVGGQLGSLFGPDSRAALQSWFDSHPPVPGR